MRASDWAPDLSATDRRARDLVLGLAIAPWSVLAAGKIRTDAEEKARLESGEGGRQLHGDWRRTEEQRAVCAALEKVAKEIGAKSITSGTPTPLLPLSLGAQGPPDLSLSSVQSRSRG